MRILPCLLAVALSAGRADANDNWPQFRGPNGDGRSDSTGLPVRWSELENIAWKTPIHDYGWSSPVVWGDQVWLTTATEDGHQMFAVALDRQSGRVVHDVKVFDTPEVDHIAPINSYASPTSAIEDGRVYVHYGTYGTASLDTASGKVLWTRRDLKCDHHEGPGSSPILWGDRLIVHVDGRDVQYVIALDKKTGKTVWKSDRSIDYSAFLANTRKAFCTPTVVESAGRLEMISPAARGIFGYDPRTGQELWKVRHGGWSCVPRPIVGGGLAFVVTDYEHPQLWAIRLGGQGDVTESGVAWKLTKGVASKASLLLIDGLLYLITDDGVATCVEAKTGEVVWKDRLEGSYAASPVYADGRIYLLNHKGVTTTMAPGRKFQVLAESPLEGESLSSPAVAGKALFVRTRTHLYRIEKK